MRDLSRPRLLAAFLGLCAVGAVGRAVVDAGALVPLLGLVALALTVTVRAYKPDDPPRRAWIWLACAAWLAVVGETVSASFGPGLSTWLMALSNAMWCASLLDARRKILAGALVPPLARPWRWALVAAVLVGLAVAVEVASTLPHGSPVYPTVTGARLYHLGFVELCDAVVLVAGVWLLGALHPLWGGAAARPFLLVTAAAGIFAVSDLIPLFVGLPLPRLWTRALIIGGWSLLGVAGLAQLELRRAMFARTADLRASLQALGPRP
ncbi:hypothetical protein SAMN02745121_00077 [Nannocystis exedens]|uniref:Uncharacterized protein n=1 Tax=Nannocystis exedens TaxID=54 RepID=A0A1I1SJF1_9BACT|nr:hypothetical protein [Nannocystis exedens]PCC75537.1 hypothetical protein NAEX_08648 [Nannocystis exedens]SFD46619.1 hypothetical protein SAMN02745121_00077 [Nannocystis exedens]